MSPRRTTVEHSKGVFEVEWPLFGELSRALALKVARDYDPDVVVGIATAGVVPGAVIAAILGREFHSMVVSRRFGAETVRETPAVLSAAPPSVRDRRILVVDETCDTGDTIRLAVAAMVNAGIDYVNKIGITNIRAHAKPLTDRLQKELPALGYKPLTPLDTDTPIVAFEVKDAAATTKMLQAGHVAATVIANENRLRLSVSVFNNHEDIDRVVAVLGGKPTSL